MPQTMIRNHFSAEYARSNRSTCHGCNIENRKRWLFVCHRKVKTSHTYDVHQLINGTILIVSKNRKTNYIFNGNAETLVDYSLRITSLVIDSQLFRFAGFNDLNKEDQTELKKKFGSTTTVNRKRKNEKTASSTNDNDDAPKVKTTKNRRN